jgi:hypothetical protein
MKSDAGKLVEEATTELGISLADLLALASVWVAPELYRMLEPVGGVWYPQRRRANLGLRVKGASVEAVGQLIDGVTLDNNTYANVAFKRALGIHRTAFVGFHICHIWGATAYDPACYTNIANLVAIPAELSSLTDHHPHIVACLKFRAWELYHWTPAKEVAPVRPERYPVRWREPWPVNDEARRAASRRVRSVGDDEVPILPVTVSDAAVSSRISLRTIGSARTADAGEGTVPVRKPYLSGDAATHAALEVAFYLSKFDHERLGLGNQGQTFDRSALALGVNRSTLKHYRDSFDSHTGSSRKGWKAPLSPQLAASFAALMRLDEPTLRQRVLGYLR